MSGCCILSIMVGARAWRRLLSRRAGARPSLVADVDTSMRRPPPSRRVAASVVRVVRASLPSITQRCIVAAFRRLIRRPTIAAVATSCAVPPSVSMPDVWHRPRAPSVAVYPLCRAAIPSRRSPAAAPASSGGGVSSGGKVSGWRPLLQFASGATRFARRKWAPAHGWDSATSCWDRR